MSVSRLLAREQRAFLARDRENWDEHLSRARAFFAEGLRCAVPETPVLVLGAGTGLEIPWRAAPSLTFGWDADPWSRIRTGLRHLRFPPWIFQDFTGGLKALEATTQRAMRLPGSKRMRARERAIERLAGLIPSLHPRAESLRDWIGTHRPGTILVANVLGQVGCVAQRVVEEAFGRQSPWGDDPDLSDPLMEALDAWTLRSIRQVLEVLLGSGAEVWMIHDRAVIRGDQTVRLKPLHASWIQQLVSEEPLEVSDPLCGLDVREVFADRRELRFDRWLWPVGPGQLHMMEALAYSS